jgi:hypothetical protein
MWWKERKAPPKLILEEITDQNTSDVSLEKLNNFFVII